MEEIVALWTKLKNGDINEVGDLYDHCVDMLYSYGIHLAKNYDNIDRDQVMDAIHDVFLDLYKYRRKLASNVNVKAYLQSCLKRHLLKCATKPEKYHSRNVENVAAAERNCVMDDTEISAFESIVALLQRAQERLTHKQRQVILLRFYENKSYQEIGNIMNITPASARTLIYRTITILKKMMVILAVFFLCFEVFA